MVYRNLNSYIKINIIFAGVIAAIMLYSVIFSANNPHPIKSFTQHEVASTGLSRAFSEIVRLNFEQAVAYNTYALKLFSFFFFQGILRIIFSILMFSNRFSKNLLVYTDILISVLLFLYCFGAFIVNQWQ